MSTQGNLRWVLLRHDLPDGSWHYDWMMERAGGSGGPLMTFRLTPPERPDEPGLSVMRGERLGDHRREYLTYEGPVSEGRGRVKRVAGGGCVVAFEGSLIDVTIGTPAGARRWVGGAGAGGQGSESGEVVEFILHESP